MATPVSSREWLQLALCTGAIGAVSVGLSGEGGASPVTAALAFLLIVLFAAAVSRLWVALATSIIAVLALNYFFLPPVGTFTIASPDNWVAFFTFLVVSIVASHLSARAQARAEEAVQRRHEVTRLFDLSRDVLLTTDAAEMMAVLTRSIARRFGLDFVAIATPHESRWEVVSTGTQAVTIDEAQLWTAFAAAKSTLEFDAHLRVYAGHRSVDMNGTPVRLVPLRVGARPIGLMVTAGPDIDPGALDALAGISAIAIERAAMLDERQAAALTRQNEQLKTTLLASLGHDLRTPLTAIRVAAANISSGTATADERQDQIELIVSETERLNRLFQNLLDMARLDADAITAEARWTFASEIISAARDQLDATLRDRAVQEHTGPETPIKLDPRLAASALAHVLENAAQYTSAGIDLQSSVEHGTVTFRVGDHGPGILPADLPHLFERFYRGQGSSTTRTSGTGMGLWIARSLLALQGGRIWAENRPEGGAQFTLVIPVLTRSPLDEPAIP